jgi:hypothetical protein
MGRFIAQLNFRHPMTIRGRHFWIVTVLLVLGCNWADCFSQKNEISEKTVSRRDWMSSVMFVESVRGMTINLPKLASAEEIVIPAECQNGALVAGE